MTVYLSVGLYLCHSHTFSRGFLSISLSSLSLSLLQQSRDCWFPLQSFLMGWLPINKQAECVRVCPPAVFSGQTAVVLVQTDEGTGGSCWRGRHALSLMEPEASQRTWLEWGPTAAAAAVRSCKWRISQGGFIWAECVAGAVAWFWARVHHPSSWNCAYVRSQTLDE